MTETTKTIFEKYEIRKTKAQKTAFIEYIQTLAKERGYSCRIEQGSMGARNIVIGDPERAKVVYTAHYDTCPVMPVPNFITPKCFPIYLLYQIGIAVLMLLAAGFVGFIIPEIAALAGMERADPVFPAFTISYFALIGLLILLLAGPANRHTANDNTSGVTLLVDILCALPEEKRDSVALVFFDLEEVGLIGSASFAGKHKRAMKDRLLVNFDCVSDGGHILFALRRSARKFAPALEKAFVSDGSLTVEVTSKGVFYPSDQMNFPRGVGVAALKRAKLFGVLYMDRIHTPRDTVYREENIAFLAAGAVRLPELL